MKKTYLMPNLRVLQHWKLRYAMVDCADMQTTQSCVLQVQESNDAVAEEFALHTITVMPHPPKLVGRGRI